MSVTFLPLTAPPEKEPGEPTEPKVRANEGVNWAPETFIEAEANERGPAPNSQQASIRRGKQPERDHREPLGPKAMKAPEPQGQRATRPRAV